MIYCKNCKHIRNYDEDGMVLTCDLSKQKCYIDDISWTTMSKCPLVSKNATAEGTMVGMILQSEEDTECDWCQGGACDLVNSGTRLLCALSIKNNELVLDFENDKATRKINYCPMCGRKLKEEK